MMPDVLPPWQRALHESGHILVALRVGDPLQVQDVDIECVEDEGRGGAVRSAVTSGTVDSRTALKIVMILFGGCVAEVLHYKKVSRNSRTDASGIRQIFTELARISHHG